MPNTRDRLLTATTELFRRYGYRGTSLKQIVHAADATVGSLYHFFPDGKDELTAAAVTASGQVYRELFEMIAGEAPTPAAAVAAFFDGAAATLEESDYIDPCPIGGVAREVASTIDPLRLATEAVFASWIDSATTRFTQAGLDIATARALATTVVASLEGGFVMARTARDAQRLRCIGEQITRLVEATLAAVPAR